MEVEDMFAENEIFELDGNKHAFVRFIKPDRVMAWKNIMSKNNENTTNCGMFNIREVPVDTLKFLKVWDEVSPDLQQELESIIHEEIENNKERMQKARAARKSKYINVPREIACTKCGAKQAVVPSLLVKKVEKIAKDRNILFNIDDYIKVYQCQKCCPTKGRKLNPELANLPRKLVCKCGAMIKTTPSYIFNTAKTKGVSAETFVKTWVCQKCNPTKGLGRGRKTRPELANLPKKLVCKCGATIKTTPSYIFKTAKSKGVTTEEFIKTWKCQVCNPTKGRGRPRGKKNKV